MTNERIKMEDNPSSKRRIESTDHEGTNEI